MWDPQVAMEDSERYKMQRNLSFGAQSKTRNPSKAEGNKSGWDQGADSNGGWGRVESIRNIWLKKETYGGRCQEY